MKNKKFHIDCWDIKIPKNKTLEHQKDIVNKQHLKDLYSKSSLMCVYCTKLEPIFKIAD